MNYRNRALLDLAYELECTLRIPNVCEGGIGEPCHANHATWGKGGAMKAHDFAFASGCRACHMALDQGSRLDRGLREHYWLRGHVETIRQLWERGLLAVAAGAVLARGFDHDRATRAVMAERRKNRKTTRSSKTIERGQRIV